MILTKKVVIIGCSSGIIIDNAVMKKMELSQGDLVEVRIKKIE